MIRRRTLLAGIAASAMMTLPALAETVELTVWDNAGNPGREAAFAAFEAANPDIKLNVVTFASEEYKTQLRVTVAGGNTPDLFTTNGGFTFFEYVDRGAAMDITDLVEEYGWAERTEAEFLAADTDENGRIWGMPWNTTQYWQGLFYDKDFFEANDIPLPSSVEGFKDIAQKIQDAGRYPIAFGDKDGWPAILMLGDYLVQTTTPDEIRKLNTGENTWTDFKPAKDAFEAMARLAADGAFAPGFLSMNHEAAIMSWVGKRTAMLYNGTWWPNVAKTDDPGFAIGVAKLPMIDPDLPLQGTQYWASIQLLMGAHLEGEKKEAAIKLFDFLTSKEGMILYGNARKAITTNPHANPEITEIAAFFREPEFLRQNDKPKIQFLDHAFPIPVIEVIKVELQKIMQNNGYTVDEALAAIEAAHVAERKS